MILEYFTLLNLCHNDRKGWRNHPCAVWVRKSINNYRWLATMALELCKEYTYRYEKIHKYQDKIQWLKDNEPDLPDCVMTPFHLGMPDDCKEENVVLAYRKYYNIYKSYFAKWKKRNVPDWFVGATVSTII